MLNGDALKLILPAIVAVLGWFVAHQFNIYRDRANKQRDLRIQFLLEAYRRLESAANRPEAGKDEQDKFESALADIQLLGTKLQIEELMRFLADWNSSKGGASINSLLELLRIHLRNELKLEKDIPDVKIFRFENRYPNSSKQNDKHNSRRVQ
ncbi:MAG: hypothetical protein PHD65_02835 [Gallionella sp.]|nr:hypothetical protein [Gallionella sp.]